MTPPKFVVALASVMLAATVGVSGCGRQPTPTPPKPTDPSEQQLVGDFTGAGQIPGALASARRLGTVDRRLSVVTSLSARIEYTSTSGIDDAKTQVTGTVFVPRGNPPEGGWPVIAFAPAPTGIQPECAPSLSPTLLGSADFVRLLVKAGYVVTMPDYQGLGLDKTYYPYLDATTAGYNVIDAVRATRKLVPTASDRWIGVGLSEGGQATWAANELAAKYGQGLSLLGTASIAPPADITGFADAAASGGLTKEQQLTLQLILAALHNAHADFSLDEYRHGIVKDKWDVLLACNESAASERAAVADEITADDLRPASPQAVADLRNYLQMMGLPIAPAAAPMIVVYGGTDSVIPPAWIDRALTAACAMNDVIDIQLQPANGHDDIDLAPALDWVKNRFQGDPAPDSCAPPPAPLETGDDQASADSGDVAETEEGQ